MNLIYGLRPFLKKRYIILPFFQIPTPHGARLMLLVKITTIVCASLLSEVSSTNGRKKHRPLFVYFYAEINKLSVYFSSTCWNLLGPFPIQPWGIPKGCVLSLSIGKTEAFFQTQRCHKSQHKAKPSWLPARHTDPPFRANIPPSGHIHVRCSCRICPSIYACLSVLSATAAYLQKLLAREALRIEPVWFHWEEKPAGNEWNKKESDLTEHRSNITELNWPFFHRVDSLTTETVFWLEKHLTYSRNMFTRSRRENGKRRGGNAVVVYYKYL